MPTMPRKSRRDWMLESPVDMRPEYELVRQLVKWLSAAGWPELPDTSLEQEMGANTDAVIDTNHDQRIIIRAKPRASGALGRVDIKTYPDSNRIYLLEQPDGRWRMRTASNTYDPRPVDETGVREVITEMLGST